MTLKSKSKESIETKIVSKHLNTKSSIIADIWLLLGKRSISDLLTKLM